jgi:hypothetical protein
VRSVIIGLGDMSGLIGTTAEPDPDYVPPKLCRIDIEEGAEYEGERYIKCRSHTPTAIFEGRSLDELYDWLTEHGEYVRHEDCL